MSGSEAMRGEEGTAVTAVTDSGRVFVHGEYWDAIADEPIQQGAKIEVVETLSQMRLRVRAKQDTGKPELQPMSHSRNH